MRTALRFIFPVLFLFIKANALHAQWTQTNGPSNGEVLCFAVSGPNIFAGLYSGGIFLSTDSGAN